MPRSSWPGGDCGMLGSMGQAPAGAKAHGTVALAHTNPTTDGAAHPTPAPPPKGPGTDSIFCQSRAPGPGQKSTPDPVVYSTQETRLRQILLQLL